MILKWSGKLKRHFSKEDIEMENRYPNRRSTSPIMTEMQIKTTMRYHLTDIRIGMIKERDNKC